MKNPRTHGQAPFRVVVVHGGPGAAGEMAPVARELALRRGVLEPFQTATTLDGQVEELARAIVDHAAPSVTLIGYSWGAWLSGLVAAAHPSRVGRLVLVSSGPFEEADAARVRATRVGRLSASERDEFEAILRKLDGPATASVDAVLSRLGDLCAKTDAFDPLPQEAGDRDVIPCDAALFQSVWREAAELRRNGELLRRIEQIMCPVVAIHGAHDPHPADGVDKPLSRLLRQFQFVLLEKCGHTPWLERQARTEFFEALGRILTGQGQCP